MPRPLPPTVTIFTGRGALLKRPKIAVLLGILCSEWSNLELILALAFSLLMGAPWGSMLEPLVLEKVESFEKKCSILNDVAEASVSDVAVRRKLKQQLKTLQLLVKERNSYVHARWAYSDDFPDEAISGRRFGPKFRSTLQLVSRDDLIQTIRDISVARAQFWEFFDAEVRPAIKPRPEPEGDIDAEVQIDNGPDDILS